MNFKHADTRLLLLLAGVFVAIQIVTFFAAADYRAVVGIFTAFVLLAGLLLHLRREADAHREAHARRTQAIAALTRLIPLRRPLPTLTGWAASPELAATVFSEIRNANPDLVLELGSGASTVVAGYALELNERGHLISVDHNAEFLNRSEREVDGHGLARVRIVHAPLSPVSVGGQERNWYDLSHLDLPGKIDMLIVDGPPRHVGERARQPAVALLDKSLADTCIVIVDDTDRADERAMVDSWLSSDPAWYAEDVPSSKGITILRRVSGSA